jgi:hypothetical protein
MNRPVAADPAAVAGVRRLLGEIAVGPAMEPRANVRAELEDAAEVLAGRMALPTSHENMTREQQRVVFGRLDADVRERNPQLWRLKQVSDLCAGIWAQTFGEDYTMVIAPVLTARGVARVVGPVGVGALVVVMVVRRRQKADA